MHHTSDTLQGKVALITGGAGGIGSACARELAGRGARVIIADRPDSGAIELARELDGEAWEVDLLDTRALESTPLAVDVLVNNAGFQVVSPMESFDPDAFRSMIAVMLEVPFLLIRSALPHMYAQGFGRIINISSIHGLKASPFKAAYVSAKHGLEGLSKVVALEGAEHGVTSNCVNPGYVRTPLVEAQIADQARVHEISEDEVLQTVLLQKNAIKRLVEPAEVAGVVGWLSSQAAEMVTGSSYSIDGGWTA